MAVGFGTAYTPAASPWEVLEMFRVAGRHRAPAHIHVRRGVEGVQEALANAVATGTPLHIVHVNSSGGNDVGRMLALIGDAQSRGIDITTEAYPYNRGSTRIESALYDNWERMTDAEIAEITWVNTGENLTRDSFARYRKQGGSVIQRPSRMENVQTAINSPLTMIASDGSQLREGRGHPRATGTFSQVLGRYVREAKTLSLIDALRKMTVMPARRLEATDSGDAQQGPPQGRRRCRCRGVRRRSHHRPLDLSTAVAGARGHRPRPGQRHRGGVERQARQRCAAGPPDSGGRSMTRAVPRAVSIRGDARALRSLRPHERAAVRGVLRRCRLAPAVAGRGIAHRHLRSRGLGSVVATLTIDFHHELTAGQLILITGAFTRVGDKSVSSEMRLYEADSMTHCATQKTTEVCFDTKARKSAPWPDDIREARGNNDDK